MGIIKKKGVGVFLRLYGGCLHTLWTRINAQSPHKIITGPL